MFEIRHLEPFNLSRDIYMAEGITKNIAVARREQQITQTLFLSNTWDRERRRKRGYEDTTNICCPYKTLTQYISIGSQSKARCIQIDSYSKERS